MAILQPSVGLLPPGLNFDEPHPPKSAAPQTCGGMLRRYAYGDCSGSLVGVLRVLAVSGVKRALHKGWQIFLGPVGSLNLAL